MKTRIFAIATMIAFASTSFAGNVDSLQHIALQKVALTRMIKDTEGQIKRVESADKSASFYEKGNLRNVESRKRITKQEALDELNKTLKRYKAELAAL